MKYRISIAGATGYTGIELIRILLKHPYVEISGLTSESYTGLRLNKVLPYFEFNITLEKFNPLKIADKSDLVFLCFPHTKSIDAVDSILKLGKLIIDLSADFRIKDKGVYSKWYGVRHTKPALLKKSIYGLPELYKSSIKNARLLANPGCYPTSVILACAPVIKNKLVNVEDIVINSISGISGAGRKIKTEYLFSEIHENVKTYKIGGVHQHIPEIEQELNNIYGAKNKIKISFTPHLAPFNRGILTTINFKLSKKITVEDTLSIYEEFYKNEKFVRILPKNTFPETKYVYGTNLCDIGLMVDKRLNKLIVISAIDNLVKGAAGQAVQNMNIMLKIPEETALNQTGIMP